MEAPADCPTHELGVTPRHLAPPPRPNSNPKDTEAFSINRECRRSGLDSVILSKFNALICCKRGPAHFDQIRQMNTTFLSSENPMDTYCTDSHEWVRVDGDTIELD